MGRAGVDGQQAMIISKEERIIQRSQQGSNALAIYDVSYLINSTSAISSYLANPIIQHVNRVIDDRSNPGNHNTST